MLVEFVYEFLEIDFSLFQLKNFIVNFNFLRIHDSVLI
jgi:hypothetical protein